MPIFNQEYTFIHIPKTGGTSVEAFLMDQGYEMKLFTGKGDIFINGHSPQHCTYQELQKLGLLTGKVFTILRSEVDRVVSEYFYLQRFRPDINHLYDNFDGFLDVFLDKNNFLLFDQHNLSNQEFIVGEDGKTDPRLYTFDFFDVDAIEAFLNLKGLGEYHHLQTEKSDILKPHHEERIRLFYDKNS